MRRSVRTRRRASAFGGRRAGWVATVAAGCRSGTWASCSRWWPTPSRTGRRWSTARRGRRFAELDRRANAAADAADPLRASRPVTVSALLAAQRTARTSSCCSPRFKLGATPFNVHDRYTADELRVLLDDAAAAAGRARAGPRPTGWPARSATGSDPRGRRRLRASDRHRAPRPPAPGGRSGDDRYILYTGGTTGRPRGRVWRHDDLLAGALATAAGEEPAAGRPRRGRSSTRAAPEPAALPPRLAAQPRHRAVERAGHPVRRRDRRARRVGFDAAALWSAVEAEAVTMLVIVGDAFARPLADALAAEPDRWDLSRLLSIVSGGALLSATVRQELLAPPAVDRGGRRVRHLRDRRRSGHSVAWPGQADRGTSRFRSAPHTAVLDAGGQPRAPAGSGEVGMVAHRGHDPDRLPRRRGRTARAFPTIDGVRWALPGDLATVEADGQVTLLGRGSSSINTRRREGVPRGGRGRRSRPTPTVFDAVVVGVPDDRWGERVVAVVQPRRDAARRRRRPRPATAGRSWPTSRSRAEMRASSTRSSGCPTGKPDLAWARAVVRSPSRRTSAQSGYRVSDADGVQPRRRPRGDRRAPSPTGSASSGATGASPTRDVTERTRRLANVLARPRPRRPRRARTRLGRPRVRPGPPRRSTSTTATSTSRACSARSRPGSRRSTSTTATSPRSCATCSTTPARAGDRLPLARSPRRWPRCCPTCPQLDVLLQVADDSGNALLARRRRLRGARWPPPSRRAAARRRAGRPTTSTSSTPAARPACRRACCGARPTSSSAPWAAGRSGSGERVRRSLDDDRRARRPAVAAVHAPSPPFMHGAAHWIAFTCLHRRRHRRHAGRHRAASTPPTSGGRVEREKVQHRCRSSATPSAGRSSTSSRPAPTTCRRCSSLRQRRRRR